MQLCIARESNDTVWKLEELMSVVKAEVEAREASEGAKLRPPKHPPVTRSHRPTMGHNIPYASALVTNEFKLQCAYCEGAHYSASCCKVRSLKKRREILLKTGKCFNCQP